ncbi:MAG TPA: 16S rRNA (adenine(1518)-N(6)/adenine(1519)-N(6))-dimethyltransferase RsmA [Casimicrobiaceae bacterium]|nr:16S rRNA (adenine(1518)-N(6)/adenine(1519)-N(6))-dimethyltransferase RsmA [Casimicrobiaceae bacterium]
MKGHRPRKRFGQHFLADPHYLDRIARAIDPGPGDAIVEIGPGLGALTDRLIERVRPITAVEIDRDLAQALRERYSRDALNLVEGDALDFDFASLGTDLRIVGNLPYNISTPILFRLADAAAHVRDIHVMLQREVVDRIVARPATPDYGRLTVMLAVRFEVARLFAVPPGAFRPPPKVDSAVIRMRPLRDHAPNVTDFALFSRIVTAAFSQRRKTLRNAVAMHADEDSMRQANVDPGLRGEALSVEAFVRLANHVAANTGDA